MIDLRRLWRNRQISDEQGTWHSQVKLPGLEAAAEEVLRMNFDPNPIPARHRFSRRSVILAFISFLAVLPSHAEQKALAYELKHEWPLALPKGSTVVGKMPIRLWQDEKDHRKDLKIWLAFKDERGPSGAGLDYFVDVEDVLNQPHWASSSFPYCGEFTLTRIFELKSASMHHKLPYTEVELRSNVLYLRLHFSHPSSETNALNADFKKLIAPGNWEQFEKTEDFHENVFAVQQGKIFVGPMAALSDRAKLALLDMACTGPDSFGAETYKGKSYFAISLGPDAEVYNSNVMNSSARVAKIINDRIIGRVKTFRAPAQETGIDGLQFSAVINFHNFVNEPTIRTDRLEVYLPLDLCMKFVDADVTSQQLIDGSIVLLNGNRIQVPLSAGG